MLVLVEDAAEAVMSMDVQVGEPVWIGDYPIAIINTKTTTAQRHRPRQTTKFAAEPMLVAGDK
jgi:hypothetical protein